MHNIEYYTYPENVNKEKVYYTLDAHATNPCDGESGSGLSSNIRWLSSNVFRSLEEARKKIIKNIGSVSKYNGGLPDYEERLNASFTALPCFLCL